MRCGLIERVCVVVLFSSSGLTLLYNVYIQGRYLH